MSHKVVVAPSILSADFAQLAVEVEKVREAQWLHIDVMDGAFVPNITLGPPIVSALRKYTQQFFDVHLMIERPDNFIAPFADSGANQLTVHAEACTHLHRTIASIREHGMRAGVAINPHTPVQAVEWILPDVDMVLVMTVNPGFGGQSFIERTLEKVQSLRELVDRQNLGTDIQVDGGIDHETVRKARQAGANILVAGSAIFSTEDPGSAWHRLQTAAENM